MCFLTKKNPKKLNFHFLKSLFSIKAKKHKEKIAWQSFPACHQCPVNRHHGEREEENLLHLHSRVREHIWKHPAWLISRSDCLELCFVTTRCLGENAAAVWVLCIMFFTLYQLRNQSAAFGQKLSCWLHRFHGAVFSNVWFSSAPASVYRILLAIWIVVQ